MNPCATPSRRVPGAPTALAIAVLTLLALGACGDSGTEPTPPPVTVSVTPSSATVGAAGSQTVTASVANADNTAVTWTTSGGTLSGSGASVTWTAPVTGGSYTVTATSAEDGTKSATATLTVTPVQVSVAPATAALLRGEPTTFTASVSGTTVSTAVSWTSSCGTLTPDGAGVRFDAPIEAGSCVVTATSDLDPSMSGAADVTVRRASAVTADDDADDGSCTWDHCSLREAIIAANLGDGADTVYLSTAAAAGAPAAAAGRFGGPAAVIEPGTSLPTITGDLAVIGEGSTVTEIDMQATEQDLRRAFDVSAEAGPVTVALQGLTVRNAIAAGGPGLYVRDGAEVHTLDVVLTDNASLGVEGGAVVVVGAGSRAVLVDTRVDGNETRSPGSPGGGIGVVGGASLEMTGGSVSDNRTQGWGGAIRGIDVEEITLDGVLVEGNQVLPGGFGGGGLFVENPGGAAGVVTLTDVTLRGNVVEGPGGGGGAVFRSGVTAAVSNSTIEGNSVTGSGGGGFFIGGGTALTVTVSTITGNQGLLGGGVQVADATLILDGTAVDDNTGTERGGGIFAYSTAEVTATGGSIDGNDAGSLGGGGIFAQDDAVVDLTGTMIRENTGTANALGGGVAFFGRGTFTGREIEVRDNVSGSGAGLSFVLEATGTAELEMAVVDGNRATGAGFSGGGIFGQGSGMITVRESTLSNNVVEDGSGGGLFALAPLQVEVVGSVVSDNEAAVSGGGLWLRGPTLVRSTLLSGNTVGANGGAVSAGSGTVVEHSTLVGNTAGDRGGAVFFFQGGAEPLEIVNSTFSANTADRGGAVSIYGAADLTHLSLVGNTATGSGGGIFAAAGNGGTLAAVNLLFASNSAAGAPQSCALDPATPGDLVSGGGNLTDDATCPFALGTDQADADPGVDPELADNGGPLPTHGLQEGSAAVDTGIDAGVGTDQRGYTRVGAPDVGAFERGGQPGG